MNANYAAFLDKYREIARLDEIASLLSWDQETCMPRGAIRDRADQSAVLASLLHRKATDPAYAGLVAELSLDDSLSPEEKIQVREARRDLDKAVKIPPSLVETLSKTSSLAQEAWVRSRAQNDYGLFKGYLEKLIGLKKQEAACLGFEKNPYAAFLDDYEPGMTEEKLEAVFKPLKETLPALVRKAAAGSVKFRKDLFTRSFPVSRQETLNHFISEEMGIPADRSRMDVSAHPFCSSSSMNDVRRTVRYNDHFPFRSLYAAMHEGGHALYDLNLHPCLACTPCGRAVSLGVHESQSRLWENVIGRSRAFFKAYFPRMRSIFAPCLDDATEDDLYALSNEVAPSFIRVEADEATYNLHIILRFDIERAIFSGRLAVDDLPGAWNAAFEQYLGIKVDTLGNGMLQDVHWSLASFGYFPTYTLGNLIAAQLKYALEKQLGPIREIIEKRRLGEVRNWLNENIHRHGRLKNAEEIVRDSTGGPLNPGFFDQYLREKYGELYGF